MTNDLLEKDIQAIIDAGGNDSDVTKYLDSQGVKYSIGGNQGVTTSVSTVPQQIFPAQRPDRFTIKASQPYDSYSYGDALKDTGKTVVNSLANLGEGVTHSLNPVNIAKGIGTAVMHPIQTGKGIGNYIGDRYGSMEKLASTVSTDPLGYGSDVYVAATGAKALASGAVPMIKNFGKSTVKTGKNISNLVHPEKLAGEVRTSMFDLRKNLGKELDSNIQTLSKTNPAKTIDLSPHFQDLKDVMATEEGVGLKGEILRTVRKIKDPQVTKLIQNAIKNPDSAKNLTLQQSEEIKRALSNLSTIGTKAKQGKFANWTSGDIEILDLVDNIKATQAEQFSELSQLRAPYAEYMKNYNQVKNLFKPGRLIKGMKNKFGDAELNQMAEKVVPPETWAKINGYRRTGKVIKSGVKALIGEEILRRVFFGNH